LARSAARKRGQQTMKRGPQILIALALQPLAVFSVPGETRAADPVAGVFSRMTPGIHVGHFDHDQDEEQVAAVNADYLNSVKSAGFKSVRIFCETHKAPAFYAPNIQHALTNGLVVNLCLFAWDYNTKTKEAFAAHWKAVAECYKNYPDELVFELFNEPALSPKLTDAAVVMEWISAGITAIRNVSPQRILLVGGPQFMEAEFLSRHVTPEYLTYRLPDGTGFATDSRIMGACHVYEPWAYTMPKGKLVTLKDVPGWNEQVTGKLELAADWGKRWNKRVVITEWASQSAPKVRADLLDYTRFVVDEAGKRGLGWMYYCGIPSSFLGEDMLWSILDTDSGWDQDILTVLTGVKAKPAPSFNPIRNSEFVPGFTASGGWGLSGWGATHDAAVSLVQNASLSGRNALKIALDQAEVAVFQDTGTAIPRQQNEGKAPGKPAIRLRNGCSYLLTFLARAEQPGATVTVRLEDASPSGPLCYTSERFVVARQAQEYACNYLHAGADVPSARVRLLFAGEKNSVFVDKVVMTSSRDTRQGHGASTTCAKPWTLAERNGRQCLLTPAGKPFLILGLSHASGAWQADNGALTPDEKAQRLATLKQDLRDLRFNAVGYVPELVSEFAYIHNADRLLGSPGTVTGKGQIVSKNRHLYQDVFDPAFKARLREQIRDICAKTAGDTNCIGYWWTDIPVWRLERQEQMFGKSYVDFIRDLPEAAPGRIRYERYEKENGGDGDAGFLVLIARELYAATAESYRQFAPGRLLFGERYNTIPGAPLEIIAECGKVVDVISFQPYEKKLSGEVLDKVHAMTGKPIMLSDWNLSFPVGSHTNTMWPQFPSEAEAAKAYEDYLVSAFAKPYILGYYKCQYRDAVLASGQLKPGLRDQPGRRYESWAQSIARIHRSLLVLFEQEGRDAP
jgi:endoglucanase